MTTSTTTLEHDHAEHDHAEHDLPEVASVATQNSAVIDAVEGLDHEHDAAPESEPVFEPEPQPAPEPEQAPEPFQSAPEPGAAAPKRRKRGRVVAPAGPPRAVPGEADGAPLAEAASEQS